nr:hypothetical protein [Tanacetum cinerariifolium]
MNHDYYRKQNFCYDYNSIGFDQSQPQQYTVTHPIFSAHHDLLGSQTKLNFTLTKKRSNLKKRKWLKLRTGSFPFCYDDDDDEEGYNSLNDNIISELPSYSAITPTEPIDSLSMGDEHLDTILATESDEFIKSCVENLVPNASESEGENECDVPAGFTTFSNDLFDVDYDSDCSDDQSLSVEDVREKIYSNPLFDEEIIPMEIDQHSLNAEPALIESLPNHDSSVIISSKIDSLFDEFAGELTLLKSFPPGIDETDCHPEKEIRLTKRLLYDNSSPQLPNNYSLSLPATESYHFDIPSPYRPPAKPPDGTSQPFSPLDSLGFGTRFSTRDFINSSDSVAEIVSRCPSPILRESMGSVAPGNYVQWKSRIKRYIETKPNHELIHHCLKNPPYKFTWADKEVLISKGSPVTRTESQMETNKTVSQDIRDQLNAEAEASQELKVSYHKLYDILKQHQNEVNEIRAERIARIANPLALVAQQQLVYHPQNHPTQYTQNSSTRSQQAATRNKRKAIVNSSQPIYDQEPSMVAENDETSKDKDIDKLMALISLSFKNIYKPTNNNFQTSSNTSRANQDNSLRINRMIGYENQRICNVVGASETVGSTMVQKYGIQCYNCKKFGHVARECQKPTRVKDAAYHKEKMLLYQELEAHYMYMAQLQEVSPDAADSGPIFDVEPLQKVSNDDHYNVFAIEREHPEQSESVHVTYPIQQDAHNVVIDSLDMSYEKEEID